MRRQCSRARWRHVASTAVFARELAALNGIFPDRAYVAGLLHDCAREISGARMQGLLKNYRGRYLDGFIRATPALWHNPAGVVLAKRRFGVRDSGILRAIARHSIGGPGMLPLDKILFVADFSEPTRPFPAAVGIRVLARKNLDRAVAEVARQKEKYLKQTRRPVHPWLLRVTGHGE